MDFMSDSLMDGVKVRDLNVIDDYNNQYLGFDLGRSVPGSRVTRALNDVIDFLSKPKRIPIDNGLEYTSCHMKLRAQEKDIELQFIQPGKPTQNSYIERLNRKYRDRSFLWGVACFKRILFGVGRGRFSPKYLTRTYHGHARDPDRNLSVSAQVQSLYTAWIAQLNGASRV